MSKTVNVYRPVLPKEEPNGEIGYVELTAVLTEDYNGLRAVYLGVGSEEFVKKHGQKLTYKRALNYYPHIKKEDYRD